MRPNLTLTVILTLILTVALTLLRDVCPLRVPLSFSKSMGREPSVMAFSQSRVKWIWDGVRG